MVLLLVSPSWVVVLLACCGPEGPTEGALIPHCVARLVPPDVGELVVATRWPANYLGVDVLASRVDPPAVDESFEDATDGAAFKVRDLAKLQPIQLSVRVAEEGSEDEAER